MNVVRIACRETIYNGRRYRQGDPWLPEDGGDPPSPTDGFTIRQPELDPGHQADGPVVGSSTGQVFWKLQPERPQAPPATPEQLAEERLHPYGDRGQPCDEEAAAARDSFEREYEKKHGIKIDDL